MTYNPVAIHSVIVGIALGVAREPEFYPLFIALCFHQFFEGLALGTTVIDANYKSKIKSLLLTSIYGVTTPLGIAIGIFLHQSYSAESPESLLIQGIFDSLSAGVLIYTALVELMSPHMILNAHFRDHSIGKQTAQFLAVWLGAAAMAIVGKFA
jgi:zinc transporter 1/2/3